LEKDNKISVCMRNNSILDDNSLECDLYNPKMVWDKEWIYPLKKVNFDDIEIWVPNNMEKFITREFNKDALDSAVVNYGHASVGWMIPKIDIDKSHFENKLSTLQYWEEINPLNMGKFKKSFVPGLLNPLPLH